MVSHVYEAAEPQPRPARWGLFLIGMVIAASAGALAEHLHTTAGPGQGTVHVSATGANSRDGGPARSADGQRGSLPEIYRDIRPAGAEQTIPAAETWPAP